MPRMMKKPNSLKDCEECGSSPCACDGQAYKSGGQVKGVHTPIHPRSGTSTSGVNVRSARKFRADNNNFESKESEDFAEHDESLAKDKHRGVLSDLKSMKKPNLYAQGGSVDEDDPMEYEGTPISETTIDTQKPEKKSTWGQFDNYADGGEVSVDINPMDDESMDSELNETMGHELMEALSSKDKKRVIESVEAIVLSCLSRKDRNEGEM